jgi:hypothetical protein
MTPEQQTSIKLAAQDRIGYVLWLCDALEKHPDLELIRSDLIAEIRQLLGEIQ